MSELILNFGKYSRESIDDVFLIDPGYTKWLYNQKTLIGNTPIELWLDEHLPESPGFQMPWGKFKGKTLAEINASNPQYIDWLRSTDIVKKQKHIAQAIDQFKASI
jgi:uncharacterized protein (DUF3820 family)